MIKIVKFTKEVCPHCKVMDPIYKKIKEDISDKHPDKVEFYEVSLDEAPHFKETFGIKFVPAIYTFNTEDFETFSNIEKIETGHSKDKYSLLRNSLEKRLK